MSATAPLPAASTSPGEKVDYRLVALLSAAHLSDDINQGAVPAMLPFFIAANHLTYAAAAGLVLAQTLASSVLQPLFGLLADRRPSPWLIPMGLMFAGLGVAASGFIPSYGLIFAAIALSGLGVSAFHPEAARRVRFLSGSRQATTMSLFTVGGMAGFAVGPLIITPTLISFGTRGAIILALPVMVMSVLVTYRLPRLAAAVPRHTGGRAGSVAADETERWSDFIRLTILVIMRSTVFFGLNTFLPLYWTRVLHGSQAGGGYALTTFASAVAVGTLIGGRMADRYGRRAVIVGSLAAATPLLLLFLSSHGIAGASVFLVPIGLALAASASVVVVMGQEYLPNRVGFATGITLGISMSIGGLLMPVFGAIADRFGLSTAMTLLAALPVVGVALGLTLHETAVEVAHGASTLARTASGNE